jgi:uncharacterized protein related to proFAR isomerase
MAKPIKETPILTGKDAVNFFQLMKESENKRVSAADLNKIKQDADRLKSIYK